MVVKKGQNCVHVVIECPLSLIDWPRKTSTTYVLTCLVSYSKPQGIPVVSTQYAWKNLAFVILLSENILRKLYAIWRHFADTIFQYFHDGTWQATVWGNIGCEEFKWTYTWDSLSQLELDLILWNKLFLKKTNIPYEHFVLNLSRFNMRKLHSHKVLNYKIFKKTAWIWSHHFQWKFKMIGAKVYLR